MIDSIYYNEIMNELLNDIKSYLKPAFTLFYGNNHKEKIDRVIDELVVIRTAPNLTIEELEQQKTRIKNNLDISLDKLAQDMNLKRGNIDINDVTSLILKFQEDDISTLILKHPNVRIEEINKIKKLEMLRKYYNILQQTKTNNEDSVVFIGASIEKISDEAKAILKYIKKTEKRIARGMSYTICDVPTIELRHYGLDIVCLIHEINHLISKEILMYYGNDDNSNLESYWFFGTQRRGDLIYEIINTYMTLSIYKIFLKLYPNYKKYNYLIVDKTKNGYIQLDEKLGFPTKELYIQYNKILRDLLIQGEGYKFRKIVGEDNYDMYNKYIQEYLDSKFNNNDYENIIHDLKNEMKLSIKEYEDYNRENRSAFGNN